MWYIAVNDSSQWKAVNWSQLKCDDFTVHVFFVILYYFLQLSRLSELEEMVAEQDNALAVAAEKYKKSRNEISKMKKDHEEELNNLKQQMARLTKKVFIQREA